MFETIYEFTGKADKGNLEYWKKYYAAEKIIFEKEFIGEIFWAGGFEDFKFNELTELKHSAECIEHYEEDQRHEREPICICEVDE